MDKKKVLHELLLRLDKHIVQGNSDHRRLMAMAAANNLLPADIASERFLDICKVMQRKGILSPKNLVFLIDVFPEHENNHAFQDICRTRNILAGDLPVRVRVANTHPPHCDKDRLYTLLIASLEKALVDINTQPVGERLDSLGNWLSLFDRVDPRKECLMIYIGCGTTESLINLWQMYRFGEVLKILQNGLITRDLLTQSGMDSIQLEVFIAEEDYKRCLNNIECTMAYGGTDGEQDKFSDAVTDHDSDSESDSDFYGLKNTSQKKLEKLIRRKKALIGKFTKDVGLVGKRSVLNVLFIGIIGAGKSSAINTCIAALSETRYQEFAQSGKFITGEQMTYHLESFPKERYLPEAEGKDYCMPTFIDLAGFDDEDSDIIEELLRIVLYGCLPEGGSLKEAQEYAKEYGTKGLQQKYKDNKDDLMVDRIVFVASAQQEVPVNLIKRVVAAAHPTGVRSARKKTPMFGIMCKVDQVNVDDDEFLKREERFIGCLGLIGARHRYTRLVNYCDDVDKDNKRRHSVFPELDVPALRFLQVVCSSSYDVRGPAAGQRYADTVPVQDVPSTKVEREDKECQPEEPALDRTTKQVTMLLTYLLKGIIIAMFLYMIMMPPIGEKKLQSICLKYEKAKQKGNCTKISEFDQVCNDKVKLTNPSLIWTMVYLMIITVLDFSISFLVKKIVNRFRRFII